MQCADKLFGFPFFSFNHSTIPVLFTRPVTLACIVAIRAATIHKSRTERTQVLPIRASVIVPCYNDADTVDRCLRALTRQTCRDFEILLVDDGSTDGAASIAEQFGSVRVIRTPHAGAAAARNCGARQARGGILLFTDADCAPSETWVEAMLSAFADPQVVGAKGVYSTRQREPVARFVQCEYEEKYAQLRRAPAIDFVDTYSAGYRRDVFLANGGFDEAFPSAAVEDQEFSFRLAKQGARLVFAPEAVVSHRHVSTVGAYARRKFRIGYWKVRVHRRHPDKALRDSHTPPTLRLQVVLVLALAASLIPVPFAPILGALAALLVMLFFLSAIPLARFVARRDAGIAWAAYPLIVVRAVALATGLIAGIFGEVARSACLKRAVDVIGAAAALVVLAPLMALIALAIKLDSPGPVLFLQERVGVGGKPFRLFKFRSMIKGAEGLVESVMTQSILPPPAFKIPNDPRVTRVGRILRRFSLDELPQFINVLKGDMSLVGPRPEEMRVVAQYNDWQRRRLSVKPGLTGPMQVTARGALPLDERVRLELDYIERYSLWEDLRLLARTIPAIIRGSGAY